MPSLQPIDETDGLLRETPKPPRKLKPRKLASMASVTAITNIFQRRRSSSSTKTSLAGSRTASTSTHGTESLLERDQEPGKSSNSMSSASSSPMTLPSPSPRPTNQPSKRPDQQDQSKQAEQPQLITTPTSTDEEIMRIKDTQPDRQLQLEQERAPRMNMIGAYPEPIRPLQENIGAGVGRRMSDVQRQPDGRMADARRLIQPGQPAIAKSQTMGVLPTASSIPMTTQRRGSMLPLPRSGNRYHSERRSDDPRLVSSVKLLYHCLSEETLSEQRDISLEADRFLREGR